MAGYRRCGVMNHWLRDRPEAGRTQMSSLCGNYGRLGYFTKVCKELKSTCKRWGVVGHIAVMYWSTGGVG